MNRRTYILLQALLWVILYPLLMAWFLRPPFTWFEIVIGISATCAWGFNLYALSAPFLYGKKLETKKLSLNLPVRKNVPFSVHGLSGARFIIYSRTNFIHLKGSIRLVNGDSEVVHQLVLNAVPDDSIPALKTTLISSGGKGARLDQLRTLALPRINPDARLVELAFDLERFPSNESLRQETLDLEITLRGREVSPSTRPAVEFS
jgi:hypothetical protein